MRCSTFLFMLLTASLLIGCNSSSTPKQADSTEVTVAKSDSVPDMHTAEIAIDYLGTYEGTTPCADCPGIKTAVTIDSNKTFTYEMTYLDRKVKPSIEKGTWSIKGNIITLTYNDKNTPSRKIFVGENYIQLLDANGNKIKGEIGKAYILNKTK